MLLEARVGVKKDGRDVQAGHGDTPHDAGFQAAGINDRWFKLPVRAERTNNMPSLENAADFIMVRAIEISR